MSTESAPYDVPGPVTARLADQPALEPGTLGWWPVMGARAVDIRPGDLVLAGWKDDDADGGAHHHREYDVTDMAPRGGLHDTLRVYFRTTAGARESVGMLQPMALVRWGTCRTLADSI